MTTLDKKIPPRFRPLFLLLFLGYIFFVLAAAAAGTEVFLRLGLWRPGFDLDGLKIILNRRVLYEIRPRSRPDINNFGFRGADFRFWKRDAKRILFLGDSFVFATNVKPHESMPAVLQARLGEKYEVFNMGLQGYGPDQSLVQLLDQGLRFQPDMVILGLYPTNDFNDLFKNRLLKVDEHGRLGPDHPNVVEQGLRGPDIYFFARHAWLQVKHHKNPSRLIFNELYGEKNVALYESLFLDYPDVDFLLKPESDRSLQKSKLMQGVLRRFKVEMEKRGIPLMAVIIPTAANTEDPAEYLKQGITEENLFLLEDTAYQLCAAEGIPAVNLHDFFSREKDENGMMAFDMGDGHLSVEGYAYAAELLEKPVREALSGREALRP